MNDFSRIATCKEEDKFEMKYRTDFSDLKAQLPPLISRDHIEELLGGVISAKRLANLDSLGEGPKRLRIGRKIPYRTEHLLEWLGSRATELA